MAEGVDLVAVDDGDGAGRGDVEVAVPAPTASPGWKGVEDVVAAADDVEVEPLGTATKPMASSHGAKRVIVSGAKLDSDSGTAIGLAPLIVLAGLAPATPPCIFAKSSSVFPFDIALRKSPALMRAAVSSPA